MIIFGGQNEMSQISVVYPFGVHRLHTLPFPFGGGRCDYSNGTIYLCFSNDERYSCYNRYDIFTNNL